MSERAPLSVVVPTKDRPDLLAGCLAALRAALGPHDELIVVDSASTDPRIRELAANATYVRCDVAGASLARNAGWSAASNAIVAFVDDDIRVDPHWADAVAAVFADPDVAFVTGAVRIPEGQHPERPIALKTETDAAWLDASTSGVIGHSANLAVRKDALGGIGGFDDALGAGGRFRSAEDLDLFDRLFFAGFRGRYEPSVSATHEHWRRRGDLIRLEWAYGVGAGARVAKLFGARNPIASREAKVHLWRAGPRALVGRLKAREYFQAYTRIFRTVGALWGVFAGWSFYRRKPYPSRELLW